MAFTGGYIFTRFEGAAEPVVRDFPVPETVVIPLDGTFPEPRVLICREGEPVRAGEKLLEYGDLKKPLLSPVGGTIQKIDGEGITLLPSGDSTFLPVNGHPRQPWHMNRDELFDIFRDSGCSLLFGDRFTAPDDFDAVRRIIVNAVHNAPLDQAWKPEMFGEHDLFLHGIRALKALFPNAEFTVAVNKRNRAWFLPPEIEKTAPARIMSDRYPQEFPELLARDVAGKNGTEKPGSVFVVSFEDIVQAAECLTTGKPFIGRTLFVAGPGVSRPGWYRIPMGVSFEDIGRHLLKSDEHGPWRIIRGNLFSGKAVVSGGEIIRHSDREITVIREHAVREFYRFLNPGFEYDSYSRVTVSNYLPLMKRRLDSNVHGGVRPCVQCNFCDEVCPVGIYPHLIWKHVNAGLVEESFRLRPDACIGCGLCDYVCPSKIDISCAVKSAGKELRERRNVK